MFSYVEKFQELTVFCWPGRCLLTLFIKKRYSYKKIRKKGAYPWVDSSTGRASDQDYLGTILGCANPKGGAIYILGRGNSFSQFWYKEQRQISKFMLRIRNGFCNFGMRKGTNFQY